MSRHKAYIDPNEDSYSPRVYSAVNGQRGYDDNYTYSSQSESTPRDQKEEDGCFSWMKYGIFAANIVFALVGVLILALGTWLRTDSRFRDFLSERYRQAVHEAFWEAPTLYIFSYIMIVLGCCMIVVAFFGCCGVTGKSRVFLVIYAISVFLLLIATLSCGIYLFYKKDGIDVELSDALNYMVQHYYQGAGVVQESLDHLQQTFRCCGNAGCSDFRAFRQDPPRSCDIRCDGCHYRISLALRIGFSVALVVFFVVILFQVLALCLSLYLVFNAPKKVRLVYVQARPQQPFDTKSTLTREALHNHDLPYNLRKQRQRTYY